jgi:DNA-binding transcriptional MerR regulator
MKVADLRQSVKLAMEGDSTINERRKILDNHKKELEQRQKELDLAMEALNYKMDYYDKIDKVKVSKE